MPGVATLVLVAGPSGSGKSRLVRLSGLPALRLDDFYRADDDPAIVRRPDGSIDWDDPSTWNAQAAAEAIEQLLRHGRAEVPTYVLAHNRAEGSRTVTLDGALLLAEGIFATELASPCRERGVPVEAIWIDKPRLMNASRRLRRDVKQHRKPLPVLLRRGVDLFRREPGLRRAAIERGFTPMSMDAALAKLRRLGA